MLIFLSRSVYFYFYVYIFLNKFLSKKVTMVLTTIRVLRYQLYLTIPPKNALNLQNGKDTEIGCYREE